MDNTARKNNLQDREQSFRWQIPEYHHTEKGTDWYWAVGIISVSIAVTAVIFGSVLFALLIILATFTLSMYAARKPEIVDVAINYRGINLHRHSHPYSKLESFWIDEFQDHAKIIIKSKSLLVPFIIIPIDPDFHPEEIREYLLQYLPEEEHHEPLLPKLMEYLGF